MNRLKEIRLLRDLSQTEIARAIELTQQSYQRYEAKGASPSGEILSKLADYYDVSVDYLLGRDLPADLPELASVTISDNDLIQLYKKYESLKETTKNKLKKLLSCVLDIISENE